MLQTDRLYEELYAMAQKGNFAAAVLLALQKKMPEAESFTIKCANAKQRERKEAE